jgi:hypothetical protein
MSDPISSEPDHERVSDHLVEPEGAPSIESVAPTNTGFVAKAGVWCRSQLWDAWHFDKNPSIFDAFTALAAVAGIYFLVTQSRQTDAAINEARESNRISRELLAKSDADGNQQEARFAAQMKISEASAAAAQRSAQLTAEALETARDANRAERDAFRIDQRAWILVSDIAFPRFSEPGRLDVALTIQNVGRSPAMNVSHEDFFYDTVPGGPGPPTFFRICTATGCSGFSEENIGPNVGRRITLTKDVSEDELGKLKTGAISFLVHGSIRYKDIFGESRATNYCYQTQVDSRARNVTSRPTFVFIPCIGRNNAG